VGKEGKRKLLTFKITSMNTQTSEIDLFEDIESLPEEMKELLNEYSTKENTYQNCAELQSMCEYLGYTFEYGLDAEPFNLRKV
jgi:division protein CdvB (Snf7/Vps24/ESCRT-III family)